MTHFLRAVLVLIGIGAVVLMLWEPHLEGRNAHAKPYQIYFNDPFLAYAYIASIPFFVGLYHAFKLLGRAELRSVRIIKYCAIALIAFVAGALVIIFSNESDDRAGGVFIGVVIASASIVVAIAMAAYERKLRRAQLPFE